MQHCAPIEILDPRIAPATIITFTDADGDRVEVVSNKALQASVSFTAGQNPAELLITGAGLDGANLAVLVKRAPTGDGVVNIGRIVATGLDLGVVRWRPRSGRGDESGKIIVSIAAITIKGQILGSTAKDDHSGFVAQSIGRVKIAGVVYTASAIPTDLSLFTDDVTLRLV